MSLSKPIVNQFKCTNMLCNKKEACISSRSKTGGSGKILFTPKMEVQVRNISTIVVCLSCGATRESIQGITDKIPR